MAKNNKIKRYEVDLYKPIQCYFVQRGYAVYGEVNDCDLVAVKGDELIIVELKLTLNIELLVQATKRQRLTEQVFVAIPKPSYSLHSKKWKDLSHLIRRLELGLIIITFQDDDCEAKIIIEPTPFDRQRSMRQSKKRKNKVLTEIKGRSGNYNVGGSHQTKIMTAYKENCIYIACCLEKFGPLSPKDLRQIGTGDKTSVILSKNYYGWFERIRRGVYIISEKGREEYKENPQIVKTYYELIKDLPSPEQPYL